MVLVGSGLQPENTNYTQWFAERGMTTVYREDYGFSSLVINATTIVCNMYDRLGRLMFDIVRPVRGAAAVTSSPGARRAAMTSSPGARRAVVTSSSCVACCSDVIVMNVLLQLLSYTLYKYEYLLMVF